MLLLLLLGLVASPRHAEEPQAERTDWHYGTYLDLNYTVNFNFPENHQFRSRTTTSRGNTTSQLRALAAC
ncbi:MAG: porin, partial [Nitrospirota bacterium]